MNLTNRSSRSLPPSLRLLPALAVPLMVGCSYSVLIDTAAEPILNSIKGEVTFAGSGEPGPVMVLVFAVDDPPPPMGTGKPVTFATVPPDSFTEGVNGLRSAPFGIYGIPDGDWLLGTLMDMDGDFQPLLSATAGTTCGDWSGGYPADLAGNAGYISLSGGELVDQVPLLVSGEVTTERPAFEFSEDNVAVPNSPELSEKAFTIRSAGVHSALVDLDGPYDPDAPEPCDTYFGVELVDEDGDGFVDPHWNEDLAENGVAKIWPRVYVIYQGDGAVGLAEGERYAAEAGIYFFGPNASANPLPDFNPPISTYFSPEYMNTRIPYTELDVAVVPGAKHYHPDGSVEIVLGEDVPKGSWSVTVVSKTGQTWTLPNETASYPSTDASFDPATQASVVVVQ